MISFTELPTVEIKGVSIHALTERETIVLILDSLQEGRGGWLITHNLDHLRRRVAEREFADLCAGADLVVADGMPLVWASRLRRRPLPERVAGSNLTLSLSAAAAEANRSVFLLGGAPNTAVAAAAVMRARWPDLVVAGTTCPEPGFESDVAQVAALGDAVEQSGADIVLVALGSPKQEIVIDALRDRCPRAWWIGVGISFSFVCGHVNRAPRWMQHVGLEWFHRMIQEPHRLARRYLLQGVPFAVRLLGSSAWDGLRTTASPRKGRATRV